MRCEHSPRSVRRPTYYFTRCTWGGSASPRTAVFSGRPQPPAESSPELRRGERQWRARKDLKSGGEINTGHFLANKSNAGIECEIDWGGAGGGRAGKGRRGRSRKRGRREAEDALPRRGSEEAVLGGAPCGKSPPHPPLPPPPRACLAAPAGSPAPPALPPGLVPTSTLASFTPFQSDHNPRASSRPNRDTLPGL